MTMKIVNHIASHVPYRLKGKGIWFVAADSIEPGSIVVSNGKKRKKVRAKSLEPLPGYFFHTSEREVPPPLV